MTKRNKEMKVSTQNWFVQKEPSPMTSWMIKQQVEEVLEEKKLEREEKWLHRGFGFFLGVIFCLIIKGIIMIVK